MIRSLLAGAIIFLALVQNGPAQLPAPVERYTCTPPAGVVIHLTSPQLAVDAAGRVFCATRGKSGSQGGVVWTMDGDVPRLVLPVDPHRYNANGEFTIVAGWLYYVSANDPPTRIEAVLVPEWTVTP